MNEITQVNRISVIVNYEKDKVRTVHSDVHESTRITMNTVQQTSIVSNKILINKYHSHN